MIIGIGIDHIEISRIKKTIIKNKEKFLKRIFLDKEVDYCEGKADKYQHYAARFAAKEAVYKALCLTGREGIGWKDIEISGTDSGKPEIILYNKALNLAKKLKVSKIFLSISHSKELAVCQAIVEAK